MRIIPKKRKYSKYHVDISAEGKKKRTTKDIRTGQNIVFDSLLEQKFYNTFLVPKYKSGEIIDYELQKKYKLQDSFKYKGKTIRAIDYIADYWLLWADGHEQVIDTKGGMIDSASKIKKKMMWKLYPDLDFDWWYFTEKTGWILWDEYEKIKRQAKKGKSK